MLEQYRFSTQITEESQYYGSYCGRRHLRYKNHPDFRRAPTFAEAVGGKAPKLGDKMDKIRRDMSGHDRT